MEAMILIGGLGTRIKSIENKKPKCLINICNQPFIYWTVLHLMQNGITKIIFCTGINQLIINKTIKSYDFKNININFSIENTPLGTGGAILNGLNQIQNENFIILNGDTLFDISIKELFDFHMEQNNDLTYSLYKLNKRNTEYGGIEYKENNTITNHYNLDHNAKSSMIDAGLRIIKKSSLHNYIENHQSSEMKISFENDMAPWFIKNLRVKGQVYNSEFYDIGNPESYKLTFNKFDKMKNKLEKYFEK